MTRTKIHTVYVADGFADDCDELIQKCLQSDTLNYNVFCNIWKDTKFALTFQGRSNAAELAEISEEFIHIAKRYLISKTSNFEESVAGLFLVYALLHLQPFSRFANLRLVPDDMEALQCIEKVARKQRRHDVLYILGSLLIEGPVQYHICEREYGFDNGIKKGFENPTSIDRIGVRPKGVFYRQTEEMDLIRELAALGRRYTKAKTQVQGETKDGQLDRTLSYFNENMASSLETSLKTLLSGNEGRTPPVTSNVEVPINRSDKIQLIKQRALENTVKQMQHLVTVEQKKSSKKLTKEIQSKPGKVKSGSPKKAIPSSSKISPRAKPIKKEKPNTRKKKPKKKKIEESTDESSEEVPLESDTTVDTEDDEQDLEDLENIDQVLNKIKTDNDKQVAETNIDTNKGEPEIEITIENLGNEEYVEVIIPDQAIDDTPLAGPSEQELVEVEAEVPAKIFKKNAKEKTKSIGMLVVSDEDKHALRYRNRRKRKL